jgi:tetratricopeptide (TPR) repeat protein
MLWEWRKARKNGKLIAAVIAMVALLAFSNYDMHAYSPGLGEGLLGSIAIKQKQFPQAINYYDKVLAKNPANIALLASTNKIIAQCYFEMGNYERAIVVIDTALALYKQNPASLDRDALYEMLAMQAAAAQRAKDLPRARKILDQLLVQFPQRLETHVSLGTVYKRMKMDSEAEKEFTYVLNIDTMNVVACNNLANILRDKGNFAAADKLYRQSLLLSPGNPVILKNVERLKQVSKGRYGK